MRSKKQRKWWQRLLRWILFVVIAVVAAFLILLLVLSIREYRPEDREELAAGGAGSAVLAEGDSLEIVTWNIGYGALGDNADFFMDGGSSVVTADAARVTENMSNMIAELDRLDADVVFCQEVDVNSRRSSHINEAKLLEAALGGRQNIFAYNYVVDFVPYPLPPIGKVSAGIETFSKYDTAGSERIQLPCPFSWPVRLGNLKRCLIITRIPLEDSGKELVLINLHLEAYDSGEGKIAQTKMLKEYMDAEAAAGNYVIVGGDFNQTFSGYAEFYPGDPDLWLPGVIEEEDFPGWTFALDPETPTCRSLKEAYAGADPETFQYYLIDGFIVSENVEIEEVETVDMGFVSTDHNPVRMRVRLAGN